MPALIVVDTTAFVDTWTCDSTQWRALFLKADAGEVRICVPLVVLREFERRFRGKAREDLKKYWRSEGKIRKLMPDLLPRRTDNEVDEENLISSSFRDVRARLLEHAETLPLPTVSHEALLNMDLGRRKPFNDDGKGYRDALIWHSFLEVGAASPNSDVWLVTNNVTDFIVGKDDDAQLAPELLQQAEDGGIRHIRWARNLGILIEALADDRRARSDVTEEVEFVEEIPLPTKEDALTQIAFDIAHSHLLALDFEADDDLRYGEPDIRHELAIPSEIESLMVGHVEVESGTCHLVDDDYEEAELWSVLVRAKLSLWGFAAKWDWPEIGVTDNFWVDDADWNDRMMAVEGECMVEVAVSVLIDTSLDVLGADVESVVAG